MIKRQTIKGTWDWWRHNHSMPWFASVRMTFRATIIWPLKEVYAWMWLKTKGRYIRRKCRKMERVALAHKDEV